MEIFYTDGAKNKKGSAAAYIQLDEDYNIVKTDSIHLPEVTTSQQAEIHAVILALLRSTLDATVEIVTDSQYIVRTWEGEFEIHANEEHWGILFQEAAQRRVTMRHIPRRSDQFAKKVDNLAKAACNRA